MPVKTFDALGYTSTSLVADGIVWATDHGARVINLSVGWVTGSQTLASAVQYAYDAGVILVAGTANENLNWIYYPAHYAQTIAVGGTDELDQRAVPFCYDPDTGSNYGPQIDVIAPGEMVRTARMGGGINYGCGTSFAVPHVAGLVGIMKTLNPALGREEVRHLIQSGADDQVGRPEEDTPGFDNYHGWGRLNMQKTLEATEASISLRVVSKEATRPYFETPVPPASSYDFIRGELATLAESAAGVDLGTVVCLENDSPDPDTLGSEDMETPAPGTGFFYLGRFTAAPGAGSYGGSSRNRDRLAALGDCAN
jgi:hypothetical protein